jgi:CDP-diacylglycerol--glycerol-3-phosphate 3-phosphatidyltransferase
MNLPNKLTILRIFMIPIFVLFFYLTAVPYNFIISAVIFALASFTDFLDGYIARKYNLVSDFGKFLDPIADKVLVSTALIIMLVPPVGYEILPWYSSILVALILARELIISGFRLVASNKGIVISADKSGKLKTFFTDIAILFILATANFAVKALYVTGTVLLIVSTVLTVYSGIECILKNKDVLKEGK